jgi:hypothetical protein
MPVAALGPPGIQTQQDVDSVAPQLVALARPCVPAQGPS